VPRITIKSGLPGSDGHEEELVEYFRDAPDCPNVANHVLGCVVGLGLVSAFCQEHSPSKSKSWLSPNRKLPRPLLEGQTRNGVRLLGHLALRPCPHNSEPVWFAIPSPYDSFVRYILPAVLMRSALWSPKAVETAIGSTVLTHRLLAL